MLPRVYPDPKSGGLLSSSCSMKGVRQVGLAPTMFLMFRGYRPGRSLLRVLTHGADGGICTHTARDLNPVTLLLVYVGILKMVEDAGFAPTAPCLQGRCSPE